MAVRLSSGLDVSCMLHFDGLIDTSVLALWNSIRNICGTNFVRLCLAMILARFRSDSIADQAIADSDQIRLHLDCNDSRKILA